MIFNRTNIQCNSCNFKERFWKGITQEEFDNIAKRVFEHEKIANHIR